MSKANYCQIPVEALKQVVHKFNKNQAVLIAWDEHSNQINTVTYGNTRKDADDVKGFADRLMALISASPETLHEDRRHEHDIPEFETWWKLKSKDFPGIPGSSALEVWSAARNFR